MAVDELKLERLRKKNGELVKQLRVATTAAELDVLERKYQEIERERQEIEIEYMRTRCGDTPLG